MMVTSRSAAVYKPGLVYRDFSAYNSGRVSRSQEKIDTVALSSQAKAYSTIRKELKNVPDVREEKVNAISKQFKDGTYKIPSGKDIADKIFSNATLA